MNSNCEHCQQAAKVKADRFSQRLNDSTWETRFHRAIDILERFEGAHPEHCWPSLVCLAIDYAYDGESLVQLVPKDGFDPCTLCQGQPYTYCGKEWPR